MERYNELSRDGKLGDSFVKYRELELQIEKLQKLKEKILMDEIDFTKFGEKNCNHRFLMLNNDLVCTICGKSISEYDIRPRSPLMNFFKEKALVEDSYIGELTGSRSIIENKTLVATYKANYK